MASLSAVGGRQVEPVGRSVPADAELLPEEMLAPLLAGAYVRGVADALDAVGFAALFLDRQGRVLGTNTSAGSRLGRDLRIEAGHLMARTPADNAVLSRLIAEAMAGTAEAGTAVARLPDSAHDICAVKTVGADVLQAQKLAAIVLVEDGTDPVVRSLLFRLSGLPALK